ncbi:MAG: nucleoside triphosphate pyrophosphohydrolase [Peptococcaceae bacterium]|nr:nucleoside triphosphate pyrophosphohydrolase [Peptococcaceae bacterium]
MSPKNKITIAGLGAGSPDSITMGVWKALKSSSCIMLRTGKHPVVDYLSREGISFSTFDYIYEEEAYFEQVYARIAAEIIRQALAGINVLYAVPGHPLVAEESVRLVIEKAEKDGLEVELLPAASFLDDLFTVLRLDPGRGLQVIDGLRLDQKPPLPAIAAVITQVYSRMVAADVKLSLLELYPPEHPVTVVRGAGIPGLERIKKIPLFELDRLEWVDHLTSVFVPEVSSEKWEMGREKWAVGCEENNGEKDGQAAVPTGDAELGEGVEVVQVYEDEDGVPEMTGETSLYPLDPLVNIMARLRGDGGCPWDREQDHRSLRPYLLEETYEVLEAIGEEDTYKICEELGDLLLQIVFHAQIANEESCFNMNDVVEGISEKMIRRHPHVFGSVAVKDSREVIINWEKIKAKEKAGNNPAGLLSGVAKSLPSLMRAAKLQEKAASVGFDWPDYRGALAKVSEEIVELESAISSGKPVETERELGDLLFSVVNLARLLGIDPETALLETSGKFIRRFAYIEKMAGLAGRDLSSCTLSELDKWWENAKKQEKI